MGLASSQGQLPALRQRGAAPAGLHRAVAAGFPGGYAAEDAVAFHFVDRELAEIVSARPDSRAYRVEARDGHAVKTPWPVRYLGARTFQPATPDFRAADPRSDCSARLPAT